MGGRTTLSSTGTATHDVCVIGGGIVGLATAAKVLARHPGADVVLLEKETDLARHQTGRNSGVIHAGVYYEPGSLKAELCRNGAAATKAFCADHDVPVEVCGKHLVATNDLELVRMEALFERTRRNGIEVERIDARELRRREPQIEGVGALFVPSTGIVDYRAVCTAVARVIGAAGGRILLGEEVGEIVENPQDVIVATQNRTLRARRLVVCGGLQSDRLARMAGLAVDHQIVPFRGEYYRLAPHLAGIVRSLIYPIPDPDLPFLGVHLTRMIDGAVSVGPNAVLGLAREGYGRFDFDLRDTATMGLFPGFWRMARKNWRSALGEFRNSVFKTTYLEACRKYCPDLCLEDLQPMAPGIRAQAVMRDGAFVHDFLFGETARMLHVYNAPSPAATSALPIGEMIAARAWP